MELLEVEILGYRSIQSLAGLPIGRPTILTGHNDAGKSATLAAIGWLLGRGKVELPDFTFRPEGDLSDGEGSGTPEIVVSGAFALVDWEQETLGLPRIVHVRRCAGRELTPIYQLCATVPADRRLRDFESMKLDDLKAVAGEFGVVAVGPANQLESWRTPLRALASEAPTVQDWVSAPKSVIDALPEFLSFSSTAEPDPQIEIREALSTSFDKHIEDPNLAGKVRDVENALRDRLLEDARQLKLHIERRCPDLKSVSVVPRVSLRQGFAGVDLTAARTPGEDVSLESSGAGRRRLVTLATWEWVKDVLQERVDDTSTRSIVIAYDEPDTHLDYSRQRELMDLFRAQCESPGVRMIVATHSLNLIDRVDIGSVAHLRLNEGRTNLERLLSDADADIERYLADMSMSMGLRNSTLLHERCFVVVEGATEQQSFPLLFRLSQGLPMQSLGLALMAADGNEAALKIASLLRKRGRRVALVLDRDTSSDSGTKRFLRPDRLRGYGFELDGDVHYLGTAELEDLFSDDQWVSVANSQWPKTNGESWNSEEIQELRTRGKFSSRLLDLFKTGSSSGPWGKPEMLTQLATSLASPEEVPEQLADVFRSLSTLAAS